MGGDYYKQVLHIRGERVCFPRERCVITLSSTKSRSEIQSSSGYGQSDLLRCYARRNYPNIKNVLFQLESQMGGVDTNLFTKKNVFSISRLTKESVERAVATMKLIIKDALN